MGTSVRVHRLRVAYMGATGGGPPPEAAGLRLNSIYERVLGLIGTVTAVGNQVPDPLNVRSLYEDISLSIVLPNLTNLNLCQFQLKARCPVSSKRPQSPLSPEIRSLNISNAEVETPAGNTTVESTQLVRHFSIFKQLFPCLCHNTANNCEYFLLNHRFKQLLDRATTYPRVPGLHAHLQRCSRLL